MNICPTIGINSITDPIIYETLTNIPTYGYILKTFCIIYNAILDEESKKLLDELLDANFDRQPKIKKIYDCFKRISKVEPLTKEMLFGNIKLLLVNGNSGNSSISSIKESILSSIMSYIDKIQDAEIIEKINDILNQIVKKEDTQEISEEEVVNEKNKMSRNINNIINNIFTKIDDKFDTNSDTIIELFIQEINTLFRHSINSFVDIFVNVFNKITLFKESFSIGKKSFSIGGKKTYKKNNKKNTKQNQNVKEILNVSHLRSVTCSAIITILLSSKKSQTNS